MSMLLLRKQRLGVKSWSQLGGAHKKNTPGDLSQRPFVGKYSVFLYSLIHWESSNEWELGQRVNLWIERSRR